MPRNNRDRAATSVTFRAETNFVEVHAIVTDETARLSGTWRETTSRSSRTAGRRYLRRFDRPPDRAALRQQE